MPIHLHITTVFLGLFLLLAMISGWYNYHKTSEILMLAAEAEVAELSLDVQNQFIITYRPVITAVDILANSKLLQAQNLEQRLSYLPMLASATHMKGQVTAFQVGYSSGDFFIVRYAKDIAVRDTFSAPENTLYIVDSVIHSAEKSKLTRLYYDQSLSLIAQQPPIASDYDPRIRPWYQTDTKGITISRPYIFYFLQKAGITISQSNHEGTAVIAADITLDGMSKVLSDRITTVSTELILTDLDDSVIAYDQPRNLMVKDENGHISMAKMNQLGSPIISAMHKLNTNVGEKFQFQLEGEEWLGETIQVPIGNYHLLLTAIYSKSDLLAGVNKIRLKTQLVNFIILLVSLPLVWFVAHRISVPIRQLAMTTKSIENFDFSDTVPVKTVIKEIDDLATSMQLMKKTISQYNSMITSMAGEKNFTELLRLVAQSTRSISRSDFAAIYLFNDDESALKLELAELQGSEKIHEIIEGMADLAITGDDAYSEVVEMLIAKKIQQFTLSAKDAEASMRRLVFDYLQQDKILFTCIPLFDHNTNITGMLLLGKDNDDADQSSSGDWAGFVQALSGFSALSIENRQLIKRQKELMESFIKLIASAIDSKSPYTGGHCQRVPEITKLLAQAACDDSNLYQSFTLNADQWEELHFACWLHDCGKVTTPEYVVDKSTKLETIYDRIHEVRMRVEVLKRDAIIEYWQSLSSGGDKEELQSNLDTTLANLDEDFAFIAECNEGGEFMAPNKIERLQSLAKKTWSRTLSDRIGISWEERLRKERDPESKLPCMETLLDDKLEHIIERSERDTLTDENPWGFKMPSPEHKYNRGELYNLSVARGTLSEEERYKINDHMIQTIIMLEQLPYPKHLRNVPVIAGGHHEKMDGTGYPKRLKKDDMPLTARMMAIADIFEALTAGDRPYKKAKSLSEAIKIMSFMKKDNHIDGDLFDLFLRGGVHLKYAEKFLAPEQIDTVNVEDYLS